jgi:hypothetical protein
MEQMVYYNQSVVQEQQQALKALFEGLIKQGTTEMRTSVEYIFWAQGVARRQEKNLQINC